MTIIMVSHEFRYSTLRWLELANSPMFSNSMLDGLASFEQWTMSCPGTRSYCVGLNRSMNSHSFGFLGGVLMMTNNRDTSA